MSVALVVRRSALVAGLSLLAMAVLAGWANFAVVEKLVTRGDAAATARAVEANQALLHQGVLAFAMVAVLDVVVAWAMWKFFKTVDARLSALAAWARSIYAAILLAAVVALARGDGQQFYRIWDAGLLLFGTHLVLIGGLSWRSNRVPRWLAPFVVLSGLGYGLDSVVALVGVTFAKISAFTFIGEVLLMGWFIFTGLRRGTTKPPVSIDG